MRRSASTIAAVAAVALLSASGCETHGSIGDLPTPSVRVGSSSRLPVERIGLFFIARAEINGVGTVRLLVDTGAEDCLLDTATAERLIPDRIARTDRLARTAGGMIIRLDGTAAIDELRAGPLTARGFRATLLDLSGVSRALGEPIDGLIGWNVLRTLPVTFDYDRGEITLHDAERPPDMPGAARLTGGDVPITVIRVAGARTRAIVDTGSDGSISVASLRSLPLAGPVRDAGAIYDVAGRVRAQAATLDGVAEVAGASIQSPIVETTPGLPRVGAGLFNGGRLIIDGTRNLVLFQP